MSQSQCHKEDKAAFGPQKAFVNNLLVWGTFTMPFWLRLALAKAGLAKSTKVS